MRCPFCSHTETSVKDSRIQDSAIRRRRLCEGCGARFTTYERVQLREIHVIKRNGDCVLFDSDKLTRSIQRATHKHQTLEAEQVDQIVSSIVRQLETSGTNDVTTQHLGDMVLSALWHVDQMAYMRFASVYKRLEHVEDWLQLMQQLPETHNEIENHDSHTRDSH